jgi:hypothetical protein
MREFAGKSVATAAAARYQRQSLLAAKVPDRHGLTAVRIVPSLRRYAGLMPFLWRIAMACIRAIASIDCLALQNSAGS